ncbi:hypothetical protein [Xanthobacter tagetidis]|uniref:Uncharacterized protein n=1 Tax=Xanthobacter tagetidis TaxID=60216 RepID=A0A3L7ALY0_9HYPH|nr:hypothetical protein [Xanthobacter tagetidis]MBB6308933.1 hypothetical protein [Xanthobacter tagetidis]RLP80558.1 hypothetical protein D9R14_05785 [Xanthobacter tagetidis]
MRSPRYICPQCGSVRVDATPKQVRCLNCGHAAPRKGFPTSLDPAPAPEAWDGRRRSLGGQVLKIRGAE